MNTPPAVGIDLGTTYSLAAFVRDGRPEVVRDASGVALVPSVVSFHDDGSVLVGSAARARCLTDPSHTVYSVKRLMGRTLADLKDDLPLIPYQVREREAEPGRQVLVVRIDGKDHTPEELSALILREVLQRAGNPTKAVITVPAYFDDTQRQATRDAGRIAGVDVLRIVNEPTAAALAYGLHTKASGTVAVYDLGGGTFDCSILTLTDGVFKVLSTNGDTHLGGDDFDQTLMNVVLQEMKAERTPHLLQQLREQAERAKIALTNGDTGEVVIGDYRRTFNRPEFEALIAGHVERCLKKCQAALRDAGLTPPQIDEVVLVGGSSRVPLVRRRVAEFFGRTPHTELNPDEVVALGAAVQADILTSRKRSLLLLDVVPLSLGIETLGGVVDKVIDRNTTVPARATTRYSTAADNQTAVILKIFQGERELAKDCRLLGEFKLSGIPPMPAQLAQVDVTFLVDADSILTVTAREQRSGREAAVTVRPGHGLSRNEVEQLVLDSVAHAEADFTARRLIEFRTKLDGDLRHTEKALARAGGQLTPELRAIIDAAIVDAKAVKTSDDANRMQAAVAKLGKATQPLAELLMNGVLRAVLHDQKPDAMAAE